MGVPGETLIGVADGRNAVSIRQLAEEGRAIPVYCYSHAEQRIVVREATVSRLARKQRKTVNVRLDDESTLCTTPDQAFLLRNGTTCKARHLPVNIRLMPFHSFIKDEKNGKHYRNIQRNNRYNRRQYRLIWEFYHGEIDKGYHVHHRDFDQNHDAIENLEILPAAQHTLLHQENMLGDNNPANRCMNDAWRHNLSRATAGEGNPRWIDIPNEKLIEIGREFKSLTGQPLTWMTWNKHAEELGVPMLNRTNFRFGTFDHFLELCGAEKVDARRRILRITLSCPICGKGFEVRATDKRIQANNEICCSRQCGYIHGGRTHSKLFKGRPSVHKGSPSFKAKMKEVSNTPDQRKKRALAGQQKALNLVHQIADFLSAHQIAPTVENWEQTASLFRQETGSYHFIHTQKAAELLGGWSEVEKLISRQNHRVVSVEKVGFDEVYDLTVAECQNYAVITNITGDDLKMADLSGIMIGAF
jgi:hypothetical protein